MPTSTRKTSSPSLSRREWLAATGTGSAALVLKQEHLQAHLHPGAPRPA